MIDWTVYTNLMDHFAWYDFAGLGGLAVLGYLEYRMIKWANKRWPKKVNKSNNNVKD